MRSGFPKSSRGLCAALGLAALAAALLATPSIAHHAVSAFDRERSVTVTGTVVRWQFFNPHAGLWLEVVDDAGEAQEWAGEFQSIQDLYRHFQWNKDTFKPGDEITMTGNPARRPDQLAMWVSEVIFSDGRRVDVRSNP